MTSLERFLDQLWLFLVPIVFGAFITVLLWVLLVIEGRKSINYEALVEPPMLPGHLPILGHALLWFKNSSEIHQRAKQFSKNQEPISISLMKQRAYIVFHPHDIAAVYRSRSLQVDNLTRWSLQVHFGLSKQAVTNIDKDPDGYGSMYVNSHAFFRDSLGPGENLTSITDVFLQHLREHLDAKLEQIRTADDLTVNFFDWAMDTIVRAASDSFVGPSLLEQNPDLLKWHAQWRLDFFTFSFSLPRWMASRAFKNRDRLLDAFIRHSRDPDAGDLIKREEELSTARGLSTRDIGVLNFAFWAAVQANATITSSWLLYFIAHHPSTIPVIRKEIGLAFSPSGELANLDYLLCNACLLTSMFYETMRFTSGVVAVRKVEKDTVIGGYLFKKGALVMVPVRPGHFAEETWGPTAGVFVPDRFVEKEELEQMGRDGAEKRTGPGNKGVKPFGGGVALCPGRHFARNEVLSYVASVVWKLDIVPVEGEGTALVDTATPTVGTYLPDREVRMRIRMRSD